MGPWSYTRPEQEIRLWGRGGARLLRGSQLQLSFPGEVDGFAQDPECFLGRAEAEQNLSARCPVVGHTMGSKSSGAASLWDALLPRRTVRSARIFAAYDNSPAL